MHPKLTRLALAAALSVSAFPAFAASHAPTGIWTAVPESRIAKSAKPKLISPTLYRTYALDREQLGVFLATAPQETSRRASGSETVLSLPTSAGGLADFRIVESPIMEPELAARHPEIRTYLGQGISDPTQTVRFDVTPKGFHAQVIGAGGTEYIDPLQPDDIDHYMVYSKRDLPGKPHTCSVTGEAIDDHPVGLGAAPEVSTGASLRTYRLALATTGEFTQFHGGTVADGLAAVVTTMNRVDGIYEREVAVRMVLVANEDQIIYTNPNTDPYSNDVANTLLTQNQSNLNTVIGNANYDIGHVAGTGGGGLAGLGVVCKTASKAQGETGSGAPVGDGYDVDYVAHEMGHQFGGNHTFNGSGINCSGGNRNAGTAYEPGSGVTIQAYAGICGGDDLQPNSEDHFHRVSLNEIITYTTTGTGGTCGTTAATGNAVPTVTPPGNFTIPKSTPFALTASGSDADAGDVLTYIWEQFDLGAANAEGVLTDNGGPLFRVFYPTTNPTRTFPSLRYILNNANVPPQSGSIPSSAGTWFIGELLPSTARTMNFRVTVRDNHAGGGGTNEANSAVTVDAASGPFAVTAPNTAVTWASGSSQVVTWNVAGTTAAPVSTANVAVKLSTDGGSTFPITLLASTPNNGSANVTVPANLVTTQARIKVEAVGNIYFDLSDADFTITTGGNLAPTISGVGSVTTRQGTPAATTAVATVSDDHDAAGSLLVAVANVPPEMTINVANNNGTINFTTFASCTLVAPTSGNKTYPVELRVTDSAGAIRTATVNINVGNNSTPSIGSYANVNIPTNTTRTAVPSAAIADGNNNLVAPTISPATFPGGGTLAIAADGTVTINTTAATTLGAYTVQANAIDTCGAQESRRFTVTVGNPNITLAVAGSTVVGGNAIIEPNECNQVNVQLRNDGNLTATGISAVLSTTTPNVSITQASSTFADLAPGQTQTSITPFTISTGSSAVCFSNIDLSLSVSYSGGAGSPAALAFTAPIGRAVATNYSVTSSSGATIPVPVTTPTVLSGSQVDDGTTALAVPAGFNFIAYGTNVTAGTTLRASSNGNLQLRNNGGASDAGNQTLPAPGTGTGTAVFPAAAPTWFLQWDDWRLDGAAGGAAADAGIYSYVVGTTPNQQWVIEWRGRIRGDGAVTTNNNRAAIVFYEGASNFDYIYELTGTGPSANGAGSTIGIQGASTGTQFTQYAFNNASLAPGTRLSFALAPAVCSAGSGACSVPPGVTVVQSGGTTNVTEGGATDSYTMVLNSQPTADVTITISQGSQVTTSPTQLVFTTVNWATPQPVTVTAVDDTLVEGAHTGTITHTAAGGNYAGISIANVVANVTDNDVGSVTVTQSGGSTNVTEGGATDSYTLVLGAQPAGTVTVTISPDSQVSTSPATSVSFTNADWNVPKTVTVTAVDDVLVEGPHTGTITHTVSGSGYTGVSVANVVANITDNDANTVDLSISNQLIQPPNVAGAPVSYDVLIDNTTVGVNAPTATFVFTAPPELVNLAWTCVADAGASCPASGSGAPNHTVSMNGGTGLAYHITANVGGAVPAGTPINTTATITVGGGLTDSNPANNSAQANAVVGADLMFKDGFE